MNVANNIQIFLIKKLKEEKISRKDFAVKSEVHYDLVNKLFKAKRLYPDLSTLLKIAKSFKCTIDEVIGRKDYYKKSQNYKFKDISLEEASLNLKSFINARLRATNFSPQELSLKIGFSESPIFDFVNNSTNNLSTEVIIALANYFKTSIDEMIGRVSTSSQEPQTLEEVEPKNE